MPDEVSHLLWTYLLLKHPRIKNMRDFQTLKGVILTYVFGVLPDVGNLLMMLLLMNFMTSNNIPSTMGPEAINNPQVHEFFYSSLKPIYYLFHSYVSLTALLLLFYLILGRIYLPLLLGMGTHITLDLFTHTQATSLQPLYPLSDLTVNGLLHWGSWTFYITELLAVAAYTLWLHKNKTR